MHKPVAIAVLALCVLAHFPFAAEAPQDGATPAQIDFVYDDEDFVENNASIRSFDTAWAAAFAAFPPEQPERGLYRPLTNFSYALDYAMSGDSARGYHIVNFLLYAVLAWLVYALALRWFENPQLALAAALIFAAHPVHCDAVDTISGRSELLALAFGIAAWLAFDRATAGDRDNRRLGLLSALLYAGASLSKETGVLLPAALVLHLLGRDGAPNGFATFARRAFDAVTVHIAVAFFYLALRTQVLGGFGPDAPVLAGIDALTRVFTMGAVFAEYMRLLIFPGMLQLDFYYQQAIGIPSEMSGRIALGWLSIVLLFGSFVGASLATLRGSQRLSPPLRRALIAGLGSFFVFLAPVSHLLDIGALMAERFLFAPSLGFIFALVGLSAIALERTVPSESLRRTVGVGLLVVLCIAGVARSTARAAEWRDGVKLWESEAVAVPDDYRSYTNIAAHWIDRGDLDAAEAALQRALELEPNDRAVKINLSVVLMERGALDEAAAIHQEMLRTDPNDFMAWYNLGNVELRRDAYTRALAAFEKTREANPNFAPVRTHIRAAQEKIEYVRRFMLEHGPEAQTSSDAQLLSAYARACKMIGDYECAEIYERKAATARK